MFESIKLRIIKGRQLKPFETAKVLQDHEDRLKALEGDDSSSDGSSPDTNPRTLSVTRDSPQVRNIKITITDGENPIQGATAIIGEITKTTGSAGGCTFNDIEDGEITINVTKYGFIDFTGNLTVNEENTEFDITLQADS